MTRSIFTMIMVAMMSMAGVNAQAQGRELHIGSNGRMEMRGGNGRQQDMRPEMDSRMADRGRGQMMEGRPGMEAPRHDVGGPRPGMDSRHDMGPGHNMGPRPGGFGRWEGRVRHMSDGRWGYYRDNRWYYYDRYFEPDYYFAHPVRHFRRHILGPVGRGIVAGAVIGAVIGAIAR